MAGNARRRPRVSSHAGEAWIGGGERLCTSDALLPTQVRQRVEQGPRILQVGGVESFGEPGIDLRQQASRVLALALSLEQTAQARGGPQLERLGALASSNLDGLTKATF